jgi:hypothetical protein
LVIARSPLKKSSVAHLNQEPFDAPQALAIDPFFVPDVWWPPLPVPALADPDTVPPAGAAPAAALLVAPDDALDVAAL